LDGRLLYETHMHTPLCRHATGEPEEYALAAERRGLRGIIVTCHNPCPDGYAQSSRMYEHEFTAYLAIIERARRAMDGRVDVRLGLECDYSPGLEPWLEKQLASAPFNYVLGSVHPQVREYRERFWTGCPTAYQHVYFEHLAQAAETGLFDCLSHPDLVKNFTVETWSPEALLDPIRRCLDRVAAAGTAMELNTSGLHKTIPEMNPGPVLLREMAERSIPVVIGADAHVPERVGAQFDVALDALEAAGYRTVNVFLERRRRGIPLTAARESLRVPVCPPN
jgi:histidinol-phosphatase (PHP family)